MRKISHYLCRINWHKSKKAKRKLLNKLITAKNLKEYKTSLIQFLQYSHDLIAHNIRMFLRTTLHTLTLILFCSVYFKTFDTVTFVIRNVLQFLFLFYYSVNYISSALTANI